MENPIELGTYSFEDVFCTITGPGLTANLGNGSGAADEGVTIEMAEEKDRMTTGADGSAMHSLIAGNPARFIVRLQKTSPQNAVLSAAYKYQKSSSLFWGKNLMTITNPISGDTIIGSQIAFVRHARVDNAKEAGPMEWEFNVGQTGHTLGNFPSA